MEGENFTAIAESRLPPGFTRDKRTRLGNAKRFVKPSSSKLSPEDEEGGRGRCRGRKRRRREGRRGKRRGRGRRIGRAQFQRCCSSIPNVNGSAAAKYDLPLGLVMECTDLAFCQDFWSCSLCSLILVSRSHQE